MVATYAELHSSPSVCPYATPPIQATNRNAIEVNLVIFFLLQYYQTRSSVRPVIFYCDTNQPNCPEKSTTNLSFAPKITV
jgi:hypothetical protein